MAFDAAVNLQQISPLSFFSVCTSWLVRSSEIVSSFLAVVFFYVLSDCL